MKQKIYLFTFYCLSLLSYSQKNTHESIYLNTQKDIESKSLNCIFLDANKTFNLPADGAFLYSSLNGEMGVASSGYNNNENYVLTIKNQYERKIFLRSHYFLTENNNDVLEIYDGKDTTAPLLKSISGYVEDNFLILSSGEYLTIHFKSNNSVTAKGYRFRIDNGPGMHKAVGPLPNPMACASTPGADDCGNAPLICNLSGYCGNTSGSYTKGNTSGLGNFCGSIENNSWLKFTASSTSASLGFLSGGCQSSGSGIQAVIYATSNCSNFTEVSNCVSQSSSSGSFTISTNVNLVPGQDYYVMIDGFAGNICNYTVTAQSGVALTPQITASQSQVCPGNSVNLSSGFASASYVWASTPAGVYPNSQSINVTPAVTTVYSLTTGSSACAPSGGSTTKTITVTNILSPANITAPNQVCYNSNVSLTSLTNGGTYSWTGPNGFNANTQTANVNNWSTANNGIYTLTINYGGSCSTQPATVNITGVSSPTVNLSTSPSLTLCAGQSVTITASGGSGSNPYNWDWNPLETSISLQSCLFGVCTTNPLFSAIPGLASTGPKATVTPNQNTQICAATQNGTGCRDNKCVNLVVLPATPSLTVSPSVTICPGQSSTLTVTGGTSYTWAPGATLNSTSAATVIASPVSTTVYSVSAPGCSGSQTEVINVVVNGAPPNIGSINGLNAICSNQTGVNYSVANTASTYVWAVPAGATITSGINSNAITVDFGNTAGTISVTATSACGTATASINVSINSNLSLSVTPNNPTVCGGGSTTLTAIGATNYTWSPSSSLNSTNGAIVIANPSATTIYTITGDAATCTGSVTATVSVSSALNITITQINPSPCASGATTLTASGASSYTWSPSSSLSSANGAIVTATPLAVTIYTVDGFDLGCTGSNTISVNPVINPGINVTVSASNLNVCSPGNTTLIASGATSYTWMPATTLNSNTGATVIATPLTTQTYTVTGDISGCTSFTTIVINVTPTPSITLTASPASICPGSSSALTASGATSYTWSPVGSLSNSTGNSNTASPVNTTVYAVVGTNGTTPNLCTTSNTIQVTVVTNATVVASPSTSICLGNNAVIYAHGGNTYQWNPTTGVSLPNDSVTIVSPTSTTIYTVTVSKNGICPGTATVQVVVNPIPQVNAGRDTTINIDENITLHGTGNVQVGFLPPTGSSLDCNFCPNITVNPKEFTCYTLKGEDALGCIAFDEVCVTVKKDWNVYIPNAFTPNGDITNDLFIPMGYGIAEIKLAIFDRWGVQIFKSDADHLGWDGKCKGKICQQDVYVYQALITTLSGEKVIKTGHVTLLPMR